MHDYKNLIRKLVEESEELNELRGRTDWVTKKRGIIIRKSDFAPEAFEVGKVYTASGKFYPLLPRNIFGKRTAFRKKSAIINSEEYFLELKGYGQNGKELYLQEHQSGDVFFGMYLDLAIKEFERMEIATKLHLPVVLPIAVIQIPREEYLKKGLAGFNLSLAGGISLGSVDEERLKDLIGTGFEEEPEAIANKVVKYVFKNYPDKLEKGMEFVLSHFDPEGLNFGVKHMADAFLSKREIGYIIRATKCPIRVGDPSDKDIGLRENREIAKVMGYTFRVLLENGYLHHCPGTGNWTLAGELTDLVDTFDLRTERDEMEEHMKRVNKTDLREFLKYLIGPEHNGVLHPYFIEGMYGEKVTLETAAERALKYF